MTRREHSFSVAEVDERTMKVTVNGEERLYTVALHGRAADISMAAMDELRSTSYATTGLSLQEALFEAAHSAMKRMEAEKS